MNRFKSFILFTAILLFTVTLSAQFDVGLKYVVNVSSIVTDGLTEAINFAKRPKPGHYVEAALGYRASRDFSVGIGLLIKKKDSD
jgi:hypothetical protein